MSERIAVGDTANHSKQLLQPSGVTRYLSAGHHTLRVSLPEDAHQNWNLDHLQLTPVRG